MSYAQQLLDANGDLRNFLKDNDLDIEKCRASLFPHMVLNHDSLDSHFKDWHANILHEIARGMVKRYAQAGDWMITDTSSKLLSGYYICLQAQEAADKLYGGTSMWVAWKAGYFTTGRMCDAMTRKTRISIEQSLEGSLAVLTFYLDQLHRDDDYDRFDRALSKIYQTGTFYAACAFLRLLWIDETLDR